MKSKSVTDAAKAAGGTPAGMSQRMTLPRSGPLAAMAAGAGADAFDTAAATTAAPGAAFLSRLAAMGDAAPQAAAGPAADPFANPNFRFQAAGPQSGVMAPTRYAPTSLSQGAPGQMGGGYTTASRRFPFGRKYF